MSNPTPLDLDALRYLTAYIKTQALSDDEADMVAAKWSLSLDVVEAAELLHADPWDNDRRDKLRYALARFKETTDA